jgi:hypothetical protein
LIHPAPTVPIPGQGIATDDVYTPDPKRIGLILINKDISIIGEKFNKKQDSCDLDDRKKIMKMDDLCQQPYQKDIRSKKHKIGNRIFYEPYLVAVFHSKDHLQ